MVIYLLPAYYFFTKKNCKKDIEKFIDFVKVLGKEDIAICEAVQSNLEKDAIDYSMINKKRENGVEYFYTLIRKDLNLWMNISEILCHCESE